MWNCPICGEAVQTVYEYNDGSAMCEWTEECVNGCYRKEFSYGLWEETIGPETWGWTWNESDADFRDRQAEREEVLKNLRG